MKILIIIPARKGSVRLKKTKEFLIKAVDRAQYKFCKKIKNYIHSS